MGGLGISKSIYSKGLTVTGNATLDIGTVNSVSIKNGTAFLSYQDSTKLELFGNNASISSAGNLNIKGTAAFVGAVTGTTAQFSGSLTGNLITSSTNVITRTGSANGGSIHWSLAGSTVQYFNIGLDGALSTGNAGATFSIFAYSDTGAYLGRPLAISRATRNITLSNFLGVNTDPACSLHIMSAVTTDVNLIRLAMPNLGVPTPISTSIVYGNDGFGVSDVAAKISFIRTQSSLNGRTEIAFSTTGGGTANTDYSVERMRIAWDGVTSILCTNESTSTTTGALLVSGGAAIAKNVFIGGTTLTVGSSALFQTAVDSASQTQIGTSIADGAQNTRIVLYGATRSTNPGSIDYVSTTGTGNHNFYTSGVNLTMQVTPGAVSFLGNAYITVTTDATSTTSGAITVAGGVGIAKGLYVGAGLSLIQSHASGTSVSPLTVSFDANYGLRLEQFYAGANDIFYRFYNTSKNSGTTVEKLWLTVRHDNLILSSPSVQISSTIDSTSSTAGGFTVAGGAGIAKSLFVGTSVTASSAVLSSLTVNGNSFINSTTSSSSNGALRIELNGANFSVYKGTGAVTVIDNTGGSFLQVATAPVQILNTTLSTSTTTGSLVVSGGIGVAKNVFVGGSVASNGGLTISQTVADRFSNSVDFLKSRAGLATQVNDELGYISWQGANGSNVMTRGAYLISVVEAVSSTVVSSNIAFVTTNAAGAQSGRLIISGEGLVTVSNTTESTSASSAALILSGGLSTAKSAFVGGKIIQPATDDIMIVKNYDSFTSGKYIGFGRWGMFMETNALTLALPNNVTGKYVAIAGYAADSTRTEWFKLFGDTGSATFLGTVTVPTPTTALHAATKGYVDTAYTAGTGLTLTSGSFSVNTAQSQITTVGTLTALGVSGNITLTNSAATSSGNAFTFSKNRAGAAVNPGDELGYMEWRAMNTTPAVSRGAFIIAYVDTVGASFVSGRLEINTTNSAGIGGARLRISGEGVVTLTNTTESSSTTSGGFQVAGGAGVSKNLNVGGALSTSRVAINVATSSYPLHILSSVAGDVNLIRLAMPNLGVPTPVSTSIVYGNDGFGVSDVAAKISFIRTQSSLTGRTEIAFSTTSGGTANTDYSVERMRIAWDGITSIYCTNESTTTTTGALVLSGGAGIAKNVYIGGAVSVVSTTDSSSTATGALTVAGGAGIAKNLFVGGSVVVSTSISVNGNSYINSTTSTSSNGALKIELNGANFSVYKGTGAVAVIDNTGGGFLQVGSAPVQILNTTNSSSAATGSLVIAGGIGVAKDVTIGGSLTTVGTASFSRVAITTKDFLEFKMTTNSSGAAATLTPVVWNTTPTNQTAWTDYTASMWTNSGSIFTPGAIGLYMVTWTVRGDTAGEAAILRNATSNFDQTNLLALVALPPNECTATALFVVTTVTDYVAFVWYNATGATANFTTNATRNYLRITRL